MVRTQYNESGDWVLPPYSKKAMICIHLFVIFVCQRRSFGISTSWGGAPRMASRMVSCSWWTLSLLRMLNIPGELLFHWHSLICFDRKVKRRVWLWRSLETWSGRWLGRAALLSKQDPQTSFHSRLPNLPAFIWFLPCWGPEVPYNSYEHSGVWYEYNGRGSGDLLTGHRWHFCQWHQNLLCGQTIIVRQKSKRKLKLIKSILLYIFLSG